MGSEWRELRLKDVVGFVADNRGKNPDSYAEEGIPVIDNYLITGDWLVNLNDVRRFIDEDTCQSFIRKHIQKDDVLVTLVGNGYGQVGVTPDAPCVIIQNTIGLRCDEENDNKFLYYLLKANRPALMNLNIGAAQPSIKVGNLLDLEFSFPSLIEQRGIASVLESLDNKITLNRQINTTLESMAQALFKSWFVDFDPVIDNALAAGNEIPEELAARAARREALRQQIDKTVEATDAIRSEQALPKTGLSDKRLPSEIQQLFPDRFVLTEEMGWVPEGWEVRSIGGMFDLLGGHPFKSSEYVDDGDYGVVTIKNVQDSKFVEACSNFMTKIPAKMKQHCFLETGDVLLSLTGNVGRVCLVSPGKYLLNQRVAKLVGKDGLSNAFVYFFFKQSRIFDAMFTIAKGTAQQNLSPIETAKLSQILPDSRVIRACQKYFEGEYLRLLSCTAESQTLTNLRDSLLPKLLAGQITIPDAEQQLAEVL